MDDQRNYRPEGEDSPAEGVRIIGPDEAAAAEERPDVVSRRAEGEPRFGDRPVQDESQPRPALRFPLDQTTDPARIERPPIDPAPDPVTGPVDLPHWTEPPTGEVPMVLSGESSDDDPDDDDAWSSFATSAPRWRDADDDWGSDEDYVADLVEHSSELRMGALADDDDDDDDFADLDDRARERVTPRAEGSWEAAEDLDWADDETDEPTRDVAVFTDDEPDAEPVHTDRAADERREPIVVGGRSDDDDPPADFGGGGGFADRFRPVDDDGGDRDMTTAVGVGVGLGVVALVALIVSPALMTVLVTAILGFAAFEWFNVLDDAEWESAGLLGIGATVALPLAIYWRGPAYYPMLLFIIFAAVFAWFLVGAGGRDPRILEGSMSTLFGVIWIGGFGSSATAILGLPDGRWLLLVAILATIAYDVGGLFIGRQLGQRPLSAASPNKTIEGLVGGMVMAFAITIVTVGIIGLGPWTGFNAVLMLGLGAACAAPLGDLTQSLLKRDLAIKDMGSVLPGHGGLLDRFDSLLFVLPTVLWLTLAVGLS